ncbi:hypothetical protein [Aquitalea sp. FJL05]|uniref:hypothetical protein n=1 Tax=Aquitalea sp. FJL05 TaxID=2153366 RepID=UPI000F592EBE|nr:hypothetical protein [Aquitalea sp. FJL05]
MKSILDGFFCNKCGSARLVKRSSRKITSFFVEYYIECKSCSSRRKLFFSWEGVIWPGDRWNEDQIRKQFTPHYLIKNAVHINDAYNYMVDEIESEIKRLKIELKLAQEKRKRTQNVYDLFCKILENN